MSIAIEILSAILSSGATAIGATWVAQKTIEHGMARALADRRSAFEASPSRLPEDE
jgi:hypothetical protein